jgi:hypothetical protein
MGYEDNAGRSSVICALSASRGRVGERACHFLLDALHRAGSHAEFTGDLEDALTRTQLSLDTFSTAALSRLGILSFSFTD